MAEEDYWNASDVIGFDFEEQEESNRLPAFPEVPRELGSDEACGGAEAQRPQAFATSFDISNIRLDDEPASQDKYWPTRSILTPFEDKRNTRCRTNMPFLTILGMLFGNDCSMQLYRSFQLKLNLLQAAIDLHDGDAILEVVLFLQETLSEPIFWQILTENPVALKQYISYLKQKKEFDKLEDILLRMDDTTNAAVIKYQLAIKSESCETKLEKIQKCYNTHFLSNGVPQVYAAALREHISLLQLQSAIHVKDLQTCTKRQQLLPSHLDFTEVLDQSVIGTLCYSTIFHKDVPDHYEESPEAIKRNYQLSERQCVYPMLFGLAKIKQWEEINAFFAEKSFLYRRQFRNTIGFGKVVKELEKAEAPSFLLQLYVELIEDVDERLVVAKRHGFHPIVIDILKKDRDREGLVAYKNKRLSFDSKEYAYVEALLCSDDIRWKN